MSREERLEAIRNLEAICESPIIAYVTGDRHPLVRGIADDDIRVLYSHLRNIGSQKRINLFIYTRGGDVRVPPRVVHLLREHTEEVYTLVPYRAHSGGTSICLGSDYIMMGEMAELSPVDSSTTSPYNPQAIEGDPRDLTKKIPISVEDVNAYLNLATERAGLINEQQKIETFRALTTRYQALALGNVHRVYNLVRTLTPQLLALQLKKPEEATRIPEITKALTETYTHNYLISRKMAKKLGLKVIEPDEKMESAMWHLYEVYEKDLHLRELFDAEEIVGDNQSVTVTYDVAYIESARRGDVYKMEVTVKRILGGSQSVAMPTQLRGTPTSPRAPSAPPPIPLSEEFEVKLKPKGWVCLTGEG